MFYIFRKVFYYKSSLRAPKSGPLLDENQDQIKFSTKEKAKEYLKGMASYQLKDKSFTHGVYHLSHGEYATPIYKIRKIRVKHEE